MLATEQNSQTEKTKRNRPPHRCLPNAFSFSGYGYENIDVTMPVDHTIEDALRVEYWANVANKLAGNTVYGTKDRRGAIIHLHREDHAFYAQLYVRAVRQNGLEVVLMKPAKDGVVWLVPKEKATIPEDPTTNEEFRMRWNVGARAYDIVRGRDGAIVDKGLQTREDAEAAIEAMKET